MLGNPHKIKIITYIWIDSLRHEKTMLSIIEIVKFFDKLD